MTVSQGKRGMRTPCRAAGALCLLFCFWAGAQEGPGPLPGEELDRLIREITPAFPAPYVQAVFGPEQDPGPLRLLGLDLAQDAPLSGKPPRVDGAKALAVTAYWVPSQRITGRVPVQLRFWLENVALARTLDVSAGPAAGEAPWEPGVVARQTFEAPMREIVYVLNGAAHLSVLLAAPPGRNAGPGLTLQDLPLHLDPASGRGRLRAERWEAFAGPGVRTLSASFRLCNDAAITLPVPASPAEAAVAGLAVSSAYAYGVVPQGNPVMEVVLRGADGERRVELLSGVHTARADYDYFPPGSQRHERAVIVESQDAENMDSAGAPFQRHRYGGRIALDPPLREVTSLEFRLRAAVVVDVFEVGFLAAPPPADPAPKGTAP
ncbi:MAG TPA: hypothetical protein PKL54_09540 [Candidatus Hydrogenedentes bacterium]|nr:hypothetical protein [Candidatus Hydrogenedentota bacterium]